MSDHPHDGYAYEGCRCVCCTNVRALAAPRAATEPPWHCDWTPDELNPGPDCPYCAGEMCGRFDGLGCTHDIVERHGYVHGYLDSTLAAPRAATEPPHVHDWQRQTTVTGEVLWIRCLGCGAEPLDATPTSAPEPGS